MALYNAASRTDHQFFSPGIPFAATDRPWRTRELQPVDSENIQQLLVPDGIHRSNIAGRTNGSGMCSIFQRAREQVRKTAERCKIVSPAVKWIQATSKTLFFENSTTNSCLPLLHAGFEDVGTKLARIVPTGRRRGAELEEKAIENGVAEDHQDSDMKPPMREPSSKIGDDELKVGRDSDEKCRIMKSGDQSVLLKIAVLETRKTLLLLAPADATAQAVIQMILSWDHARRRGRPGASMPCAPQFFDLHCAHRCRSRPALHPKQPIGMAGSRNFFLCRRPQSFLDTTSSAPTIDQRVVRLPQISSSKSRSYRRRIRKNMATILQNCWATLSNNNTSVNMVSCFDFCHATSP